MDYYIAMLICQGHTEAWDYGYSFFKTACKACLEFSKHQQVNMAIAINMALTGDKNTIEEFLNNGNSQS